MSAINQQFYGAEKDWINVVHAKYNVKKPAWTDSSASAAYGSLDTLVRSPLYNKDNKATVPLDDSIVPWKVNEKSKVFRRKYCELSFPNAGGSDPPQIADYFNQSANYKESENFAIKNINGYRFFAAYYTVHDNEIQYLENAWVKRYSPYNYKGEFLNGTSGTSPYKNIFPIVSFDYSSTVATVTAALIPKTYLDNSASISSDPSINKYYNNHNPDYQAIYKGLYELTDEDLTTNYLVGFLFKVYSGGSSSNSGLEFTIIPIDEHLAVPAGEWGGTTGQGYPYQTDFTCYASWIAANTNRVKYCQLGGATSYVNPANCGRDGAEPATYNAQYYETKGMRTMNTEDFEGEGLEVGAWTITTNTGKGTLENGRVNSWFIPKCYNNLTVAQIRTLMFKELAYLGFWFTDNVHDARYVDMKNHPEKYYLPEIDANGVTTGNYKPYSEASDERNYNWTTDVFERTPYNPSHDHGGDDGDPNTYQDASSYVSISGVYAPTTERYLMTEECLKELLIQLQKISIPFAFPEEYNPDDLKHYTAEVMNAFGTTNPLELIDAIIAYPVDFGIPLDATVPQITQLIYGTAGSLVVVGNSHCDVSKGGLYPSGAQNIEHEAPFLYFPTWEYYNKYKSFLDYSPYSSSVLTLPWCGSVNLDPEIYIGNKLNILYNVDIDTGLCKAVLYNDGKVIDSINGQVGARIAIETADYNNQVNAAIQANQIYQQQRFNQIKSIAAIATAGLATVATGGAGATGLTGAAIGTTFDMAQSQMAIDQANYRVEAATVPYKQVVSGTDSLSLMSVNGIHQVIYRPEFLPTYNKDEYGHLVGFATLEFGILTDYHGYTEIESIDFDGVAATEVEQEMIKSALKTGVYLP